MAIRFDQFGGDSIDKPLQKERKAWLQSNFEVKEKSHTKNPHLYLENSTELNNTYNSAGSDSI